MKAVIEDDGNVFKVSRSDILVSVQDKSVKELTDSQESQLKDVIDSNFDKSNFDENGREFYEYYAENLVFENGEFSISSGGV